MLPPLKPLPLITASILLAGCCNLSKDEVSFQSLNPWDETGSSQMSKTMKNYPNHMLACRSHNQLDYALVDNIINEVKKENKDVVLYFHGGLSDQEYMAKNLGKKLMESVFDGSTKVNQSLYPIFINYEAGLLDWDKFSVDYGKFINSALLKELLGEITKELKLNIDGQSSDLNRQGVSGIVNTSEVVTGQELQARALSALFSSDQQPLAPGSVDTESALKKHEETLLDMLEEKETEQSNQFLTNNSDGLKRIAIEFENYQGAEATKQHGIDGVGDVVAGAVKVIIEPTEVSLRITRILARFALGTDHGTVATIQEELYDFGFKKIPYNFNPAFVHWDKVKTHAKQCFMEGSSGRRLVDNLIEYKKETGKAISTLSHSAGSIPTAELISYLAKEDVGMLDNVVMLVPAINQNVFSELVIDNNSVFNKLDVFSLSEKYELKDKVGLKIAFGSSLLYAVSSLAERGPVLDRMLLIDQHMKPKRSPYQKSIYKCISCEDPDTVWSYFEGTEKSEFHTYPFTGTPNKKIAATHEQTKYPWVSTDLAGEYLELLGIKGAKNLKFYKP